MDKYRILKQYFGYDSFREGQEFIIDTILGGGDVLGIMPTGAGKSLCYQVPALMLPGISVVVSPLISLMNDQVRALNEAGVHAAYINSTLTDMQVSKALQYAAQGKYKIIYVAPERLSAYEFMQFVRYGDISMVTVDEAHCISQWGQDFRPSYLKIIDFIRSIRKRPIVSAFTATATKEVREDILCALGLQNPKLLVTGFDRKNLFFSVERPAHKEGFLKAYLEEHREESGIIYCATRKNVDRLYELLREEGFLVTEYHAGLSSESRRENQEDFIYDRKPVMIATNAFGMGIDKSNVRYVVHYNMPQNLENYYQEAGRAGRDQEAAECVLLYSPQDIVINRFLLEGKELSRQLSPEEADLVRERDEIRLRVMTTYCTTTKCLREYILRYFGETDAAPCGNCSNCLREYEEEDVTAAAYEIINCVLELRQRFGVNVVVGTLQGRNNARLREYGAQRCRAYGRLKQYGEEKLKQIINELLLEDMLRLTTDKYSLVKVTAFGMEFWREAGGISEAGAGGVSPIMIRTVKELPGFGGEEGPAYEEREGQAWAGNAGSRKRISDILNSRGLDLFEALRSLRTQIAREEGMPPYIIFSDRTLLDMCIKTPLSEEDMLNVNGVGQNKYHKYGERFLQEINGFTGGRKEKCYFGDRPEALSGSSGRRTGKTGKKKTKSEFILTRQQAMQFVYRERYLAAELAANLSSLTDTSEVKKLTGKAVFAYVQGLGYADEKYMDGRWRKVVTEEGSRHGLELGERIGQAGTVYEDLYYKEEAQRLIVEHFVGGSVKVYDFL